jgi:hypothetical protein
MSRTFRSLGIGVLAICVAATAFAAPAQGGRNTGTASKASAAATHSVAGKLEKYDPSANSIVVNTGKGTETLTLASDSSIRMGAARLNPADLTAHAGAQVKVRYSEANGQRTVQTIQLEGGSPRAARAQTPAKK